MFWCDIEENSADVGICAIVKFEAFEIKLAAGTKTQKEEKEKMML